MWDKKIGGLKKRFLFLWDLHRISMAFFGTWWRYTLLFDGIETVIFMISRFTQDVYGISKGISMTCL